MVFSTSNEEKTILPKTSYMNRRSVSGIEKEINALENRLHTLHIDRKFQVNSKFRIELNEQLVEGKVFKVTKQRISVKIQRHRIPYQRAFHNV